MRRLRPAVVLAFLAFTAVWVAPGSGSHDPVHPFAGEWAITFSFGGTGTFTFDFVEDDAAGLAQMNAIAAKNNSFAIPCEDPTDYYEGTWTSPTDSGTLAGCTTGDDRSIYAPYTNSGGVGFGVYLAATLGSDDNTFSGSLYSDIDGDGLFSADSSFDGTRICPPLARGLAQACPEEEPPEEPPPPPEEPESVLYCKGQRATIIQDVGSTEPIAGTDGSDVIVGTAGFDVIVGGGGDDLICGRGGPDQIDGGEGRDFIYGEGGDDVAKGGASGDNLDGGPGNDTLYGGVGGEENVEDGRDGLVGGPGNDTLRGGPYPDGLDGGPGNDTLDGGEGGESLSMRFPLGDTAFYGDSLRRVTVDLRAGKASGQGSDTLVDIEGITGSFEDDILRGSGEPNWINGNFGDDRIWGRGGDDYLSAEKGDDKAYGGPGDDELQGGSGDDLLIGEQNRDYVSGSEGVDTCSGERRRGCERLAVGVVR
jgi:Ca2+-binding RTX toxin-like protein